MSDWNIFICALIEVSRYLQLLTVDTVTEKKERRYFQSSGVLKNIFLAKNHIFRSKINTSSEGDIPMTPPKRNWLHFLVFKKEIEQFIMGRHKGGKDGRIARRDLNRRFWGAINEKTQQKLFTKKICLNSEEVNKRNKFSLEIAAKKIDFLN